MKWIRIDDTTHRYVSDDDPRPEDTEWVNKPREFGPPAFIERAPWATHERAMHTDNPTEQKAATDAFLSERDKHTQSSSKWARWERSRKAGWAKDKPTWRKKRSDL